MHYFSGPSRGELIFIMSFSTFDYCITLRNVVLSSTKLTACWILVTAIHLDIHAHWRRLLPAYICHHPHPSNFFLISAAYIRPLYASPAPSKHLPFLSTADRTQQVLPCHLWLHQTPVFQGSDFCKKSGSSHHKERATNCMKCRGGRRLERNNDKKRFPGRHCVQHVDINGLCQPVDVFPGTVSTFFLCVYWE